ncbi:MAG: hypothetical protein JW947_00100 [Sedimentisphaerales bacterium]|nr:hypothetical protein [Sedimentisphaerales bacterium]
MKPIGKMITVSAVLVCMMLAPAVIAAESAVGEWEFKSKFEGRSSQASMTIKKTAEDKYEGTWSAQWGESTLSDIVLDNGKLTFVQTSDFGGREMKTTYEAKVEGAKLTGTGTGQFGEVKIEGALQGDPNTIAGEWQLNVTVPPREIVDTLTITKDVNGVLEGKWTSQRGENTISDMKLDGNKLTFTRKSKMGEMEFEMTYEGTVEDDQIKGAFMSDFGEREANATRSVSQPQGNKEEMKKPEQNKEK